MSRYGKTYPLGSSEAMELEPRLDEDYYLGQGCWQVKKKILSDEYLEDALEESMSFYINQIVEETRR